MHSKYYSFQTMKKETGTKMSKSTESIQAKLGTIRANGANVAMFENIVVKGANAMSTKLRQISSISVANAMKVTIQPFDHSQIKNIEEAVCNSGLQLRAECSDDGVLNIHVIQTYFTYFEHCSCQTMNFDSPSASTVYLFLPSKM